MATAKNGKLVAAALFCNYDPYAGTIEIVAASDDPFWMSRSALWDMFDYCYHQCECQAVVMRASVENVRLQRICRAYGFAEYVLPNLRGRGISEVIYILTDDAWRANGFHKENGNGKVSTQTHAAA